jgi:hypothetical protein
MGDGSGPRERPSAVEDQALAHPTGVPSQTFNYLQGLIPAGAAPPPMAAKVRYQAMNSVPENWIPLIPVHVPNNNREIQLQRAAMPRILVGDTNAPQKVQPLTSLLRQDLDLSPAQTYFSPRGRSAASWCKGDTILLALALDARPSLYLVAVQKQTGRGEASSGLAFDRLVDKYESEG